MTMKSCFFITFLFLLVFSVLSAQPNTPIKSDTKTTKHQSDDIYTEGLGFDLKKTFTAPAPSVERFYLDIYLKDYETAPFVYLDTLELKYYLMFNKNDDKKLKLVIADNSFKILREKEFETKVKKLNIITRLDESVKVFDYSTPKCVLNNENELIHLYFDRKNEKFGGIIISKKDTNIVMDTILVRAGDKEKFINVLTYETMHYLIGYEKENNKINIYPFNNKGEVSPKKTVSLPEPEKYDYKNLLKDLQTIDYGQQPYLYEAGQIKKIFLWKDQIIVNWIDRNPKSGLNYVFLLKININTLQTNLDKWALMDINGKANSFVYKDKVFILKKGEVSMDLLISNLEKPKEIIKSYSASVGPIWFRNSELVKRAKEKSIIYGLSDSSKLDIKASTKFVENLDHYNLGMVITSDGENYQITIGGFTHSNKLSPTKFLGAKVDWDDPLDGNEIYFKALLNENTLEHEKGVIVEKPIENEFFDKIAPKRIQYGQGPTFQGIPTGFVKYGDFYNAGYFILNQKFHYCFRGQQQTSLNIVRER